MRKKRVVLLFLALMLAFCSCRGQAGYPEQSMTEYQMLENGYEPQDQAQFYVNALNFQASDPEGHTLLFQCDHMEHFSGDMEYEDREWGVGGYYDFRLPDAEYYVFQTESEWIGFRASYGRAYSCVEGDRIRKMTWTPNSWTLETEQSPIVFDVFLGEDESNPQNVCRYVVFLELTADSVLNLNWTDNQLRVYGAPGELCVWVHEVAKNRTSEKITVQFAGDRLDLFTDSLMEGLWIVEDEAGTRELEFDWGPSI